MKKVYMRAYVYIHIYMYIYGLHHAFPFIIVQENASTPTSAILNLS